ncbi:spermidine synthase [Geomonas sp. RF6]|uniref:spermidine synthase n=1 Tax=Geomonas sp. RF6 TaxID=2897342 RepID=UPI001E5B2697|nr:spermidine synthase [Geomonas sp. RF6]UFS69232.1 spermidine synthase [Geomonas sp. RF6]
MAQPWKVLDKIETDEGILELRQRAEGDFLITVGNLVLMNSLAHRSEVALGALACAGLMERPAPRVLVGGLGMGYTLKAVLDNLPADAEVVVAELNPVVLKWCQGPLASLTGSAVTDPRVTVEIANVADVIKRSAKGGATFDAIVLDLYKGPHAKTLPSDPLYGAGAIDRARAALKPGGAFAIWGENYDEGFARRLSAAGFSVTSERPGRGGLRHVVFLARLPQGKSLAKGKGR